MGLFKKNKKKNIEQNDDNNLTENKTQTSTEEIEILDLDSDLNTNTKNKNEERKENRILLIILVIVILIVILLPQLTSWINKKSVFSYTDTVEDIINTKTVDGMLPIGETEGTITAKKIRFYNPDKKTNNEISIIYLPETGIKNVNELNIYIELFNSNKTIIHRTKFTNSQNLERKVQGIYRFKVNETIYKEAKYAKVSIIKNEDFNDNNETLVCNKVIQDDEFNVNYKVTYSFGNKGLVNYKVSKSANPKSTTNTTDENNSNENNDNETNNTDNNLNNTNLNLDENNSNITAVHSDKYKKLFASEAETLEKTNIKDLFYNDTMLEYTIKLKELELGKSEYEILHNLGDVKRQIKLEEEQNNWSCE